MDRVNIWDKHEIVLEADGDYDNPYMDVDVFAHLKGPGFEKNVYGFWDGGNRFLIRVTPTAPGEWSWESSSNRDDTGLNGKTGWFVAEDWNEEAKAENPLRRGFIRPTPNGKAFMYADGTPFVYIADTWWGVPTFRFPWYDDDLQRDIGPEMGFKDMVRYRKNQGYNGIAMIAAHPFWAEDDFPSQYHLDDEYNTPVRSAWKVAGNLSKEKGGRYDKAKDMHNEGGRPFCLPGKVPGHEHDLPDLTRINPEYFRYMDRKVDYLNEQGFVPFIEVARRDCSKIWKKYYPWPESYARYIMYVFTRYQANNILFSPIHFDAYHLSLRSEEFNEPANLVKDTYGIPPFGQPMGTNADSSTYKNYGADARWLTFHQIGNNHRTHDSYWYLTQIFRDDDRPALNGEPYYPGFPDDDPAAPSETADQYNRSALYGSFLSGGLAGYIYGVEGLWGCEIDEEARYKIWDALEFRSGKQTPYLLKFIEPLGPAYQNLIPDSDMVVPNKTGATYGLTGWAYAAAAPEKDILLGYLERGYRATEGVDPTRVPEGMYRPPETPRVRSLKNSATYLFQWFDPRGGRWLDEETAVETNHIGELRLPPQPSDEDWGFRLTVM